MGDLGLTIIIFLIQRLLLPILPASISFLPIETFSATLTGIKTNLIYSLSGVGFFMPVDLILALVLLVIFAEISLMVFKLGVFVLNLVRGSGA